MGKLQPSQPGTTSNDSKDVYKVCQIAQGVDDFPSVVEGYFLVDHLSNWQYGVGVVSRETLRGFCATDGRICAV